MTTLSTCLEKARDDGYTLDFEIRAAGLCVSGQNKCFSPQDVKIDNFYRFEGDSDPGDNIILYLIKTTDGTKGTVSDAYGTYADPKLSSFMQEVEDINKKVNQNKT